jgi:hypothetical protein
VTVTHDEEKALLEVFIAESDNALAGFRIFMARNSTDLAELAECAGHLHIVGVRIGSALVQFPDDSRLIELMEMTASYTVDLMDRAEKAAAREKGSNLLN